MIQPVSYKRILKVDQDMREIREIFHGKFISPIDAWKD